MVTNTRNQGLILPTKNDRKIFCILSKFSVFCKLQQKFEAVFLWEIYRKKWQNSCQLAPPKNLCRIFFLFYRKNLSVWFPCTHNIQKPNRGWFSDSILCQYRTFDIRTKMSGFRMASLVCIIKKRVINNILFITKRSRLQILKNFGPVF